MWHTELAFIQGGDTPRKVVPSHLCQQYAIHLIRSFSYMVQNTVDMFGPNNIPLSFSMP